MKVEVLAVAVFSLAAIGALGAAPPQAGRSASGSRSVWTGVFTEAQDKRGAAIYSRECSTCHGERLKGGEGAPALTGSDFNASWNGQTVADLFDRIRQTMPAPPEQPGKLTPQQNADVVAHILERQRVSRRRRRAPDRHRAAEADSDRHHQTVGAERWKSEDAGTAETSWLCVCCVRRRRGSWLAAATTAARRRAAAADVQSGRGADSLPQVHQLPSSGRGRADGARDLPGCAALGPRGQDAGGQSRDAAVVRRSEVQSRAGEQRQPDQTGRSTRSSAWVDAGAPQGDRRAAAAAGVH